MYAQQLLLLAGLALPLTTSAETVLGAYIFHRHGDRTPKALAPANLTDLGYAEVYQSGQWFRQRYVRSGADFKIAGMNTDLVKQSQISVSAPSDTVLMNSAQGFLQGLYPPVGTSASTETLRNGSSVTAPMNGYQLIPISTVSSGTGSESSAWLQGSTGCANAVASSNEYFSSPEYMTMLNSTQSFYTDLTPVINSTFASSAISFLNAYTIFDYINVAEIHNSTIPNDGILTDDVLFQLRTLADNHEWNLAYNSSAPIRAIAGATLAAQILQQLNTTITGGGKSKLCIQFGSYGTFTSFFGLADLQSVSDNFTGVCDYASAMVFELFTNGSASPFPSADEINVRFLFHNGTVSNTSEPTVYPLFGQQSLSLPWSDFVTSMNKFAIGSGDAWCQACGNTTGICASSTATSSSSSSSSSASASPSASSSGGMSRAVAGVIGAMVTLAVILGIEGLILLLGGLRLVSKKRLHQQPASPVGGVSSEPKA